jgi:putative flippase GtrA
MNDFLLVHLKKLIKFTFGGILTFSIKVTLTVALTEFVGLWYLWSYLITLVTIVVFSFFYNAFVTFLVTSNKFGNFLKYSLALLTFMIIDATTVGVLTEFIKLPYLISIIVVTFILFMLKYVVYDRVVFIRRQI